MVRAAIQYPATAKDSKAKDIIGGQITDVIWIAIHETRFPVASMGINSSNIDNLYALFTQKCDRKFQMVEEIVDAYHKEYPNGARISVTRDRVTPNLDTIQVFGPSWTDGQRSSNSN